jgi:hydrogenase expression/formation protein HypE
LNKLEDGAVLPWVCEEQFKGCGESATRAELSTAREIGVGVDGERPRVCDAHEAREELSTASFPVVRNLVVSTDSFVVTPIEFKGGDIGKLAVCGTVNDVLMMGAIPKYLTCGFIMEEGLDIAVLDRIVASMAAAAREAGVLIVAGDTKVIEGRTSAAHKGKPNETDADRGLMINTTGIGILRAAPSASNARPGDVVIVSGNLGDHHACILSARMGIESGIKSDCALLCEITDSLFNDDIDVHVMRDVTRGGLGTVLNEIASASSVTIELSEREIPVDPEVAAFCGVMGLDPIYMGNEGKAVVIVPHEQSARALEVVRTTEVGRDARIIGKVSEAARASEAVRVSETAHASEVVRANEADDSAMVNRDAHIIENASEAAHANEVARTSEAADSTAGETAPMNAEGLVIMRTRIGGTRRIDVLFGEGLPRIC